MLFDLRLFNEGFCVVGSKSLTDLAEAIHKNAITYLKSSDGRRIAFLVDHVTFGNRPTAYLLVAQDGVSVEDAIRLCGFTAIQP